MPENFSNRYQTTLAAGVTSGALTGTVTTATGAPAVPFRAIISAEGANTDEIVLVTGRTGTTLTWTRAAEAIAGVQAASAHVSGATITAIVTAAGLMGATGMLDVRAFGASVAAADNVLPLQAALDAALASGRPIYVPDGTFLTSALTYVGPVAPGVGSTLSIIGAGRGQSILKPVAGGGTVLTLSGPLRSCRFTNFGIDGTGGTGHGIYYSGTGSPNFLYESTFENLEVTDCALNGIYIKSSFANRYVNVSVSDNGNDQLKVWGGPSDYYERIDIGSVVSASYAGIRALYGGKFVACNGIYNTAAAAGPMFKFGGDGSADSDSRTTYPVVEIHTANVESFTGTGISFVQIPGAAVILDSVTWAVASTAVNARAVDMAIGGVELPVILRAPRFTVVPVSWANSAPLHGNLPFVVEGGYNGVFPAAYRDGVGAYPVSHQAYGVYNANTATYLWKPNRLTGYTDIGYLASARIGEVGTSTNYVDRTAAPAMPTSGTYRRGDIVDNCSHTIAELGTAGSKYTLTGWRRLTDGSAHVLNTDWLERRELTGN